MKKRAFTLIELLAVIIILGILMIIAIPSISKYIDSSRKSSYIESAKSILQGAAVKVTKGEINVKDKDTTYYIPYTCVTMENAEKAKTPYGEYEEAYVVVTHNEDDSYDYHFYGYDTANMGVDLIIKSDDLTNEKLQTGIDSITTDRAIGDRKNVVVYGEDCSYVQVTKRATKGNVAKDPLRAASFDKGTAVNATIKKLLYGSSATYETIDTMVQYFTYSEDAPGDDVDYVSIQSSTSAAPIYVWFEEANGTLYWYSEDKEPTLDKNCANLFYGFKNLKEIDEINKFDTSKVETMRGMFWGCESLETLDVSRFDTSNVTSLALMFRDCFSLRYLDVSNWDTSKVKDMAWVFLGCNSLTSLDVSNWETSNVTDMALIFSKCKSLRTIDVSNWNTSKVTNMDQMFGLCNDLEAVDVSNFDTSKVKNMYQMFYGCKELTTIDVSGFDTSSLTGDVSISYMFSGCNKVGVLDVSQFNTSKVTKMSGVFSNCKYITSLNVSNWNTSNVTSMYYMFISCESLTSLDVSHFNTSNVTDMDSMFMGCKSLKTLDLSNFNTSNVKYMGRMFMGCKSLESLDISNFDITKQTSIYGLFTDCVKIKTLDLSSFDTANIRDMDQLFSNCNALETIYVSNKFVTTNVTNYTSIFYYTIKLVGQNGTTYSWNAVSDITYARVDKPGEAGFFTLKV